MTRSSPFGDLRVRLFILTVAFVLTGLALAYPLLAANYRNSWLQDRAQAAEIALLAVEAAPDGRVSEELSQDLLERAQVIAVVIIGEDFRELVLAPAAPISGAIVPVNWNPTGSAFASAPAAIGHLLAPGGRFLQIDVTQQYRPNESIEFVVPEDALRADLIRFSRNLIVISLATLAVIGAILYFAVYALVVAPMRELTGSIVRFGSAPESADVEFSRGGATEMRRAKDALRDMQHTVSKSFRERKRLADLGEVVAKINHDLRNSLATAQIVSDSLAESEDPRVRRAAPRLERSIRRAVGLAEATLSYGKAEPPGPQIQPISLAPLLREAVEESLSGFSGVEFEVISPDTLSARGDPDHVYRIVTNLCRNAARAVSGEKPAVDGERARPMVKVTAREQDDVVVVEVADNGPGVPERILPKLFQPFVASGARDGAGLGLAISLELARGMRGDLTLLKSDPDGAVFRLALPRS